MQVMAPVAAFPLALDRCQMLGPYRGLAAFGVHQPVVYQPLLLSHRDCQGLRRLVLVCPH